MPALDERKGRAIKSDDGLIVGHAHPVPQTSLERTRWLVVLTGTGAKSWDSGGRYGARAAIKEFANEQGNAVLVEYHGREVSKVYPDLDRFAPVSGGLHEEAGRTPDRKRLGEMMHAWSGALAGEDSVGAVASYYFIGKVYPDQAVVERALLRIESDIPKADRGAHGWTKRDANELRTIAANLKYFLKHDYTGLRAEEESGRIPNRKQLGLLMQNWHSGMGDPIYAVGSYYFADKPYPEQATVDQALEWFETVTGRDARDTREIKSIVSGLRYFLKHDYAGAQVAEESTPFRDMVSVFFHASRRGDAVVMASKVAAVIRKVQDGKGKWSVDHFGSDQRNPKNVEWQMGYWSIDRDKYREIEGALYAEFGNSVRVALVAPKAGGGFPPSPLGERTRETSQSVDDPLFVIQGLWSDGTISEEFGYDDEETAVREAKKLKRSPHFEGDRVRVISADGEQVWNSDDPEGSSSSWRRMYPEGGARRGVVREADPTSDHATIQRMIKFYTEQKGIGDYVDNSAIPMGNGVWQFHTRPFTGISTFRPRHGAPRSGIEKHEVTHAELARAWKSKGVSETKTREAGRRRTPTRVPFVPDEDEALFDDPASIERFIERELAKHGDQVRPSFASAADDAERMAKKYDADVRAQDRAYPGANAGKEAAAKAVLLRKSEALLRKASKSHSVDEVKKKAKKRKAK